MTGAVEATPTSAPAGVNGGLISSEYRFSTSIVDGDPGAGRFRYDNAVLGNVTEIFIDDFNSNGTDVSNFLALIAAGDRLYIQAEADADDFQVWNVTVDAIDETGWFSIGVALEVAGNALSNNARSLIVWQIAGDLFVTKVGTPVDNQIAVWTGDGTLEGDPFFTYGDNQEQVKIEIDLNSINEVGLLLIDPDSSLNPDGWQLMTGQGGLHDGTLILTDKPADAINNRKWTVIGGVNGTTTFGGSGAAVPDGAQFKSEQFGALAYFQPRDITGREETKISFVGFVGGTGHEGVFSIEGFAYGNSGLQFHRLAHFVIDADYRLRSDNLGIVEAGGPVLAGDDAAMGHDAADGLQLTGQGSVNDVTIFNDAKVRVLEIPTGTTTLNAAGDVRPAGTVQWDKGADIASAATLVLGSDGNSFDVTGTTTITAVSAEPIGTVILLHFDDVVTLTHDATDLDLQGDVDMVTAAGDTIGLHSYDGTNWREIFRNDGQQVRVSGSIADQAMVRGNGGAKRIQDTGNLIGDDDEIIMAGTVQLQSFTDTELDDITDAANTTGGKVAGAMVFNSTQGHAVTAQGAADGSVWNDGVGTTVNTPV